MYHLLSYTGFIGTLVTVVTVVTLVTLVTVVRVETVVIIYAKVTLLAAKVVSSNVLFRV